MTIQLPEDIQALLQPPAIAYVATIGPRGEPHVSPVIFSWDGTHLRFGMNVIRQKRRNLERDPRIALAISEPGNPFHTVEIRGTAIRLDPDDGFAFHRSLSNQYFGTDGDDALLPGEERVVVTVAPERYFGFGATPPQPSAPAGS